MKKVLLASLLLLSLFSCREKDKVDVASPAISSVLINDSVSALHVVQAPSTISLQLNLTDNSELNQVKVDITPADYSNTNSILGPNTGEWSYSQIINLNGTTSTQDLSIVLPDSICGNWNVKVELSDDVGYLATPYSTLLRMENENLPDITATTTPPIADGIVTMSEGTNLDVFGTVFDSDSLAFVQVRLESLSGVVLSSLDIPFSNTGVSFTPSFDDADAGHYMLIIEGRDQLGYRKLWGVHVVVN